MSAETHRLGHPVCAEDVLELLCALLADETDDAATATLAALGVDADRLGALWEAVSEEFGERSLGPDLEPHALDPSMTLQATAVAMATLLRAASDDG